MTARERLDVLWVRRGRVEAVPGRCEPGGLTAGARGADVGEASSVGSSNSLGGGAGSGPRGNARGPAAKPSRPIPHTVQYRWAGWTTWPFGQSPGIDTPHWVQYRWAASTS
jgi:hypothetical protein